MISCPAANGIRWVKPARYAVSPSCTNFAIASFIGMTLSVSNGSRSSFDGDELEAVADDALLLVDAPQLRADGHPDGHVLGVDVGHLADDLGPLLELDDGHRVDAARLLLLGELRRRAAGADEGDCVHLAATREPDLHELGRGVAVLAN